MEIHISDHFNYKKLLRFTLPSIIMMVFTSIYGVVDGLFVSNFVGKTAFAAVNLVAPFLMVMGGVGAMLGTGGSALVAKTIGEGDTEKANRYFTMMIKLMALVGILFSVLGILFIRPVSYLLGASEAMIEDCVTYGRTILIFNAVHLMQYTFQSFLVTAEKPKLGLAVTVMAGLSNILLDALFIAGFSWGIFGAALATGLSQCVGGLVPLAYFLSKNENRLLRFTKSHFEIRPILKACANGASEMLSTVSGSLVGLLYNRQLMRYIGENGVAAYGVIMYAAFIFIAIFSGYAVGSAPIVGYHYGAANHSEVKNMLKKSMTLMLTAGAIMTVSGFVLSDTIAQIFVGYDAGLKELTVHAFQLCSFAFLIIGVNIYASSFFTALNDGAVSAAISFLRSLVFQVLVIMVLPILMGVEGIWYSLLVSEICSLLVTLVFLASNKKKYQY